MARLNSFYLAPEAWPENGQAFLRDKEANHLSRVLRHQPGDTVRLFDGQGRWGLFEVLQAGRKEVELQLQSQHHESQPSAPLTLALGWNKSSRRDWILEKSVELQGSEILFWKAEHSQGNIPSTIKPAWSERIIQAAKQCGSVFLPRLGIYPNICDIIDYSAGYEHKILLWERQEQAQTLSPEMLAQGKSIVIIGPEGGLAEDEAQQFLTAGFLIATLGSSILRWETAAMHCLSLAFYARQP